MSKSRDVLKWVVAKTCPPALQQKIRGAYLSRRVLGAHEFHEPEMVVLKSLIGPGEAVVDIGANVGAYTKELSRLVGARGSVFAFEPVAANHQILQTVVRKGRLANVQCFRMALGAKIEQREITIPALGGFTGYYWAHFARPGEGGEKVDVSTLDTMRRQGNLPAIDFIKCDVEGSELEVLDGAAGLLGMDHPAWLIEVSRETSAKVFAVLTSSGYQAFVYSNGLVPTAAYRDGEFSNYFFFHPASKAWARVASVRRDRA